MASLKFHFVMETDSDRCKKAWYVIRHGGHSCSIQVEPDYYTESVPAMATGDLDLFRLVCDDMGKNRAFEVDDLAREFGRRRGLSYVGTFIESCAVRLQDSGHLRTAEIYRAVKASFGRFLGGTNLLLAALDASVVEAFEAYLLENGLKMNSVSFYMRALRAVYNKGVRQGLTHQNNPFRNVYTGVARTAKRAVGSRTVQALIGLELGAEPRLEFARDMFLLGLYMRGMAFVDLAYLEKTYLKGNFLTYSRRKTGQMLCVRCERPVMNLIAKYSSDTDSPYLLRIISNPHGNVRRQFLSVQAAVNNGLKELGRRLQLGTRLTYYVARHTWASIAREQSVPLQLISEGLGHDSEKTTRIYLATVHDNAVDVANKRIIRMFEKV